MLVRTEAFRSKAAAEGVTRLDEETLLADSTPGSATDSLSATIPSGTDKIVVFAFVQPDVQGQTAFGAITLDPTGVNESFTLFYDVDTLAAEFRPELQVWYLDNPGVTGAQTIEATREGTLTSAAIVAVYLQGTATGGPTDQQTHRQGANVENFTLTNTAPAANALVLGATTWRGEDESPIGITGATKIIDSVTGGGNNAADQAFAAVSQPGDGSNDVAVTYDGASGTTEDTDGWQAVFGAA